MKKSPEHLALKLYQQSKGNFRTLTSRPLKKESDLSSFYYPGVAALQKKMLENPELEKKLTAKTLPIGLLSTQGKSYYPILTAKAGLLSMLTGMNVIPLLIRYDHFENLPTIVSQMSINFQAVFLSEFRSVERETLRSAEGLPIPYFFLEEMEAAAVLSGIESALKFLKKSPRSLRIVLEGDDLLMMDVVKLLVAEGFQSLTLLDERGKIYQRRPNMNKTKIKLASLIHAEKSEETREKILEKTDLYLSTRSGDINAPITKHLPDRCVIISLKAEQIDARPKQVIISTLPNFPNHVTDLHIPAVLISSLMEGKPINQKSVTRAIRSLAGFYKSPSAQKMIPGLLEKNLVKKLSKNL